MTTTGKLKVKTFDFTWEIHEFSKKGDKVGDTIYSPTFKIGDGVTESEWRLLLFPHGETEKVKDALSLFLKPSPTRDSHSDSIKTYAFKLALLDDDDNRRHEFSSCIQFQSKTWGFSPFLKRDILMEEKSSLLINDILKIFCCITVNPYSSEELKREKTLLNNYETLYLGKTWSDLTFVIGAKKIKAHKNILSVRSKVFSAMLEHDMKEGNTDIIEIDDVSYEVMDELLSFLYCGKVRNIKQLAKPLLIAADKYDVSSLKAICEKTLFENLQVDNACEILIIADRYNCERLKSESVDFVIKNIAAVTVTPEFKEIKNGNVELLEVLLCKIGQNNK